MKPISFCLIAFALLVMTAHRLPAPIEESPTPAPTVAPAAEPRKSPPKPKSKPTGAARFAGTWTGRITIDRFADTDVRLIISTNGTSVAQTSQAGVWTRPLTYDGKLLSWRTGPTNRVSWTLQLNPDEQSALVTRTWSGIQTRGIFKRVRSTDASASTMSTTQCTHRRPSRERLHEANA
jgi:hypothetical protein